jgi:hypothetical protein
VKTLLFLITFCFLLVPMFPQSKMTFDNALNDYITGFASRFPNNRKIAVVAFETDRRDLMVYFVDTMIEKLSENGRIIEVYEREKIENLQKELNFSLAGYVSDETTQLIGHFTGADTVFYGSFNRGSVNRMTITSSVTETGRILYQKSYDIRMDSRLSGLLGDNSARLWTIGISVGSSFSRPLVIGTVHGTIAPFRY